MNYYANKINQTPNIGSEAVYIARAILNYEPTKLNKQDIMLPFKTTSNEHIAYYPNPAYQFARPLATNANAITPCSSKGGDDVSLVNIDSTTTMEAVIPENSNLAVQMRYLYMSMLYNANSELFANEIAETEQGLYDNIPLIAKINELAQADSTIDKAIDLNQTLAPINEMEIHRKFVNSVYLNYVAKGNTLSSELIDELYTIANMAPNIGGEGVYIARAILNYEPTKLNKQDIVLPFKTISDEHIASYPNPANDFVNITNNGDVFEVGTQIAIYNLTGKLITEQIVNSESNQIVINLKGINQGLYLCVIKSNKEIISSFKISVVKQ